MTFKTQLLRLLLIGTALSSSLAGCSQTRPDPPPQVIACPKPVVDPQLLVPAKQEALSTLQNYLQTLPPSAEGTLPN